MTKFNVGDKVIFNKENTHVAKQFDYKINKPYEVQEVFPFHHTVQIINEKGSSHSFDEERFELVETKPTKNQRITALENEVAELKLIVHELRDGRKTMRDVMNEVLSEPSTTTVGDIIEFEGQQYRKVDREACEGDVVIITKEHESSNAFKINKPYKVLRGIEIRSDHPDHGYATYNVYTNLTDIRTPKTVNVYELIESKPLTPNQQRAAIIEQAKKFVEDNKTEITGEALYGKHKGTVHTWRNIYVFANKSGKHACNVEFVVDAEKRTITALMRGVDTNNIYEEATAKCNPSDVFNEHIGKAIALGRALCLDVSEFEQAVQPTEFAIGQEIEYTHEIRKGEKRTIESIRGDLIKMVCGRHFNLSWGNSEPAILNDTNAKYEVSSNE